MGDFIASMRDAGCDAAIVHARKAVLGGLSPKDNREVPPLRYEVVRRLRRVFPTLPLVVNGGLRDARGVLEALGWCDGVMLGREAYHRPYLLAELEPGPALWRPAPSAHRARHCLSAWNDYAVRELAAGEPTCTRSRATCSVFMRPARRARLSAFDSARVRARMPAPLDRAAELLRAASDLIQAPG